MQEIIQSAPQPDRTNEIACRVDQNGPYINASQQINAYGKYLIDKFSQHSEFCTDDKPYKCRSGTVVRFFDEKGKKLGKFEDIQFILFERGSGQSADDTKYYIKKLYNSEGKKIKFDQAMPFSSKANEVPDLSAATMPKAKVVNKEKPDGKADDIEDALADILGKGEVQFRPLTDEEAGIIAIPGANVSSTENNKDATAASLAGEIMTRKLPVSSDKNGVSTDSTEGKIIVSEAVEGELWELLVAQAKKEQGIRIMNAARQGGQKKEIDAGWGIKLLAYVRSPVPAVQAEYKNELLRRGELIDQIVAQNRLPLSTCTLAHKIQYILDPANKLGQFAELTRNFLNEHKQNKIIKNFVAELLEPGEIKKSPKEVGVVERNTDINQMLLKLQSTDKIVRDAALSKVLGLVKSSLNQFPRDPKARVQHADLLKKVLGAANNAMAQSTHSDKHKKQFSDDTAGLEMRAGRKASGAGYAYEAEQKRIENLKKTTEKHGGGQSGQKDGKK